MRHLGGERTFLSCHIVTVHRSDVKDCATRRLCRPAKAGNDSFSVLTAATDALQMLKIVQRGGFAVLQKPVTTLRVLQRCE
jgi:hypothetical protein